MTLAKAIKMSDFANRPSDFAYTPRLQEFLGIRSIDILRAMMAEPATREALNERLAAQLGDLPPLSADQAQLCLHIATSGSQYLERLSRRVSLLFHRHSVVRITDPGDLKDLMLWTGLADLRSVLANKTLPSFEHVPTAPCAEISVLSITAAMYRRYIIGLPPRAYRQRMALLIDPALVRSAKSLQRDKVATANLTKVVSVALALPDGTEFDDGGNAGDQGLADPAPVTAGSIAKGATA